MKGSVFQNNKVADMTISSKI